MIDLNLPHSMPSATEAVHSQVDLSTGPAAAPSSAASVMHEIGSYVEHHPGLCFATAFVVGVTSAWWLKRV